MTQQTGSGGVLAVRGRRVLSGTVTVDGSTDAALLLLATAAVMDRPVTLANLPASRDVEAMCKLVKATGSTVVAADDEVNAWHVAPSSARMRRLNRELAARIRGSYFLPPALLRRGVAELPWPGGVDVGDCGMELHVEVYEAFGDTMTTSGEGYRITAAAGQPCTPVEITLPFPSRGATGVALLRALAARRPLLLRTPSKSLEVAGLVQALNSSGHCANFQPDGTLAFTPGVTRPARWRVPGDRILAGTLLCALAMTGGHGRILGVDADHLAPLIELLAKAGIPVTELSNGVGLSADVIRLTGTPISALATRNRLASAGDLGTDFTPALIALALTLPGIHCFADEIHPGWHANLLPQLRRLGAVVTEDSVTACQVSRSPALTGSHVEAVDSQTGWTLLIAGLLAEGTTVVSGLSQSQHGDVGLPGMLRSLGADITEELTVK
ncbi:hypothetical protein AB0J43_00030 [Nonomuraea fuscirosea]